MNYIIDGHNLISKIDGIKLSDCDDEAKLVLRLLNWAAVGNNRRVIVVFDHGMPGNQWLNFRSELIKPVFVRASSTADEWIINYMRNIKDRQAFRIVTSDHAIQKQADNRRIPFIKSEDFAESMAAERVRFSDIAAETEEEKQVESRPLLREEQVDAWLQLFGGEPRLEIKPYQPREKQPEPASPVIELEKKKDERQPREPGLLAPDEVDAWLELFGGEQEVISIHENSVRAKLKPSKESEEKKIIRTPQKSDFDTPLSQEDVDLWLSIFGE